MGDYERCELEGAALEWLRKSFKLVSSTFIQYTNSAHLVKESADSPNRNRRGYLIILQRGGLSPCRPNPTDGQASTCPAIAGASLLVIKLPWVHSPDNLHKPHTGISSPLCPLLRKFFLCAPYNSQAASGALAPRSYRCW